MDNIPEERSTETSYEQQKYPFLGKEIWFDIHLYKNEKNYLYLNRESFLFIFKFNYFLMK